MKRKDFLRQNILQILLLVTAVGITVTGILFRQSFLRILPLYISLVISLLQSRVSRYASLLGGFNSLLYAAVYVYYQLYGSAVYAVLFSCPLQLITFLKWRKNPWGKSTVFRKMTGKQRGLLAGGMLIVWCAMSAILTAVGSGYVIFDSTITLVGILNSILTMFAFIEYTALMIPSSLLNIGLYITMMAENPEQITYLIYSLYSFVCLCAAFVRARKLYREQQAQ
ncbi:MAG: nicotinamide mononucleotide transporter [Clostridia bacterium]|nr:nicotinamide mononucleotide transporter [Clostridia bacterium]